MVCIRNIKLVTAVRKKQISSDVCVSLQWKTQ